MMGPFGICRPDGDLGCGDVGLSALSIRNCSCAQPMCNVSAVIDVASNTGTLEDNG